VGSRNRIPEVLILIWIPKNRLAKLQLNQIRSRTNVYTLKPLDAKNYGSVDTGTVPKRVGRSLGKHLALLLNYKSIQIL
jgi:hypothetical protein